MGLGLAVGVVVVVGGDGGRFGSSAYTTTQPSDPLSNLHYPTRRDDTWQVAWQDLKDHMRKVGNVVHADVLEDHEGRSKVCADIYVCM